MMPMIATTISNSMRVKPLELRNFMKDSPVSLAVHPRLRI
jgi:hypothetical protein